MKKKLVLQSIVLSLVFLIIVIILVFYNLFPTTTYTYDKATNSYFISSFRGNTETYTVKSEYKGLAVTRINNEAFKQNKYIKKVLFESNSNIKIIESEAFAEMKSLESVSLPNSLYEIYDNAFKDSKKLNYISIPKLTYLGGSAFFNCISLKEVELPEGLLSIGTYAFFNTIIESIRIPDSIISIYENAFYNALSLENISLYSMNNLDINMLGNITPSIYLRFSGSYYIY